MSKNSNNTNSVATTIQHSYEGKVLKEALDRAGKCVNVKGHIHEIMYRDLQNILPKNILQNNTAELVKNPIAKCVDLVVKNSKGKILERIQLKDAPASISKIAKQISSGQYNSAKLVGSKETVKEFAKVASKTSKTMKSSGISSNTTNRLAVKAGNVSLTSKAGFNALKSSAKSGGAIGATVSGGFAVVKGVMDLSDGKDPGEVAIEVAKETGKGAVIGSTSSVAATIAGSGAATVATGIGLTGATATALTIGAPIIVGIGASLIAADILSGESEIFDDVCDICSDIGDFFGF